MSTTTVPHSAFKPSGPPPSERTSSAAPRYGEILLELEALARDGARLDGSEEALRAFSSRILRVGVKTRALAGAQKQIHSSPETALPRKVPRDAEQFYPLARRVYLPVFKRCMLGDNLRSIIKDYDMTLSHARRALAQVHERLSNRAAIRQMVLNTPVPCPPISTTRPDEIMKHRQELEPLVVRFEKELELLAQGHSHDDVVRQVWSFSDNALNK